MTIKQIIGRILPEFIKSKIRSRKELKQFRSLKRATCNSDNLRAIGDFSLANMLNSEDLNRLWSVSENEIRQFHIPDSTGGVNPGDRRAIHYLISAVKPTDVLEIGTHIGASTIHIASAIKQFPDGAAKLTTVDIVDVNSQEKKPWLARGTKHSPSEMVEKLGCQSFVEFTTDTSLNFAANCSRNFDFIFLDGDHSAATVYQEVPVALKLLKKNGVILLHDYFPHNEPLWSDGSVIQGPYLAIKRLRSEGLNATVLPLGKLPWATKLHSNVTSLALLLRND